MAAGRKPGTPKTGGRAPGTPNKSTQTLMEICETKGFNPFEAMLEIARFAPDMPTQLNALKEVCKYLYPQRKAVEHSGEITNPYLQKPVDELEALVKAQLKK